MIVDLSQHLVFIHPASLISLYAEQCNVQLLIVGLFSVLNATFNLSLKSAASCECFSLALKVFLRASISVPRFLMVSSLSLMVFCAESNSLDFSSNLSLKSAASCECFSLELTVFLRASISVPRFLMVSSLSLMVFCAESNWLDFSFNLSLKSVASCELLFVGSLQFSWSHRFLCLGS